MNDIEWGAEIAVNGVRPEWLPEDGTRLWYCCRDGYASVHDAKDVGNNLSWWSKIGHDDQILAIRLPATHDYYKATSRGFTYWPGGESAPEDWDGGEVLRDNGEVTPVYGLGAWDGNAGAAIGYRKRTEQPAPVIAQLTEADLAEARQAYLACKEGDSAKFYATRWGLLAPDPDLTLAKSIVGDAEAIALAIKAARENGRG